jgi:hypothetical protein
VQDTAERAATTIRRYRPMDNDAATRPSDQRSRYRGGPSRTVARTVAAAAGALALTLVGTSAALAAPPTDRSMHLDCEGSDLVIMRSNGSNWWGLGADGEPDGTVYVTTELDVTSGGETVYSQSYGKKTGLGTPTTCTADHFGSIWTVELVQAR